MKPRHYKALGTVLIAAVLVTFVLTTQKGKRAEDTTLIAIPDTELVRISVVWDKARDAEYKRTNPLDPSAGESAPESAAPEDESESPAPQGDAESEATLESAAVDEAEEVTRLVLVREDDPTDPTGSHWVFEEPLEGLRVDPSTVSGLVSRISFMQCERRIEVLLFDHDAELFAQRCPDSRGILYDNELCGVIKGIPHFLYAFLLCNSANGTYEGTLPAIGAGNIVDVPVKGRLNPRFETSSLGVECRYALYFLAYRDASPAEDAFILVPSYCRRRFVNAAPTFCAGKTHFPDAEVVGKLLQFAVKVPGAGEAFKGMIGEEHFYRESPCLPYPFGVCKYLDAVCRMGHACCLKGAISLYLDEANPARADSLHFREIAQGGDMDVYL